jgi:hypothetical protein
VNRFKGPELKLSDLKVPAVLRDLYRDLVDRRLLPLVGLVLVAIVATPFLLGGGGKPVVPAPEPIAGGSAEEAGLTVLPAEPGLREPSKRLAGLPSKDPFRQHYTAPVFNKGAAPTSETRTSSSSSSTSTSTSSTETSPEASSGGGGSSTPAPEAASPPQSSAGGGHGGPGGPGSLQPGEIQLYSFAIDVKVAHTESTRAGDRKMGAPETRGEVKPASPLPGKKAPVLTYLGVDTGGKKALMLVSPEATSLFGDNKCLSGLSTCQLLALEQGTPEVVAFGDNGSRYKFELLKIEPVKGPKIKPAGE